MKRTTADKFIKQELADLDVPTNCAAWIEVYENAIEAADMLTKSELKGYIEMRVLELPNIYFV
jgi:hypothetical protein